MIEKNDTPWYPSDPPPQRRLVIGTVVLALALLLIGLAPAPAAADAPDERMRHRADFLDHHAGVPLSAEVIVHWNDAIHRVTLDEAAELHAGRMLALMGGDDTPGAGPTGSLRPTSLTLPEEASPSMPASGSDEPFHHYGVFILRELLQTSGGNPSNACSHPGHHHIASIPNIDPNARPHEQYLGAAYSDVAAYGIGYLIDAGTQDVLDTYTHPVAYAGASDFFCSTSRVGNTEFVWNQPTITGVVVTAA